MADSATSSEGIDVGDYCRQVEDHLARVNEGHLIRIVGPAFELVRGWALEQIPLSAVKAGISRKAERSKAGRSSRALRLEFCEADVRAVFEDWRRAVGSPRATGTDADGAESATPRERRGGSFLQKLDRAIDRLSRASGRLDMPESFRDVVSGALHDLTAIRGESAGVRGAARGALASRLPEIHARLTAAARVAAGDVEVQHARQEATAELAAYRDRLAPDAWARSVEVIVDRLLRERAGLPSLDFEA